jgi:nicotinamide phosphoribosyltransferase
MKANKILIGDSYKYSHAPQYPLGTVGMQSYVEARKNNSGFPIDKVSFFGLQAFIKEYLLDPITRDDLKEAEEVTRAQGIPFNKQGFQDIIEKHDGYYPAVISAVPEGSQVEIGNVLLTAESTDSLLPWVESFLETPLLQAAWYGTTVATISRHCKEVIFEFLKETSDVPINEIPWKLADFGYRGNSSQESAAIAGAAHLTNFLGTDTINAMLFARRYYGASLEHLGYSVPASEHSTTTSWGKDGERDFYSHAIKTYAGKYPIVSLVADSYDIDNSIQNIFGKDLKEQIVNCGSTVVIRLDSGEPVEGVTKALGYLDAAFGSVPNSRGFKVLKNVRVLQGDGVNPTSIKRILTAMKLQGFSAENIVFGMGGGLHSAWDRDTFSFAMKCSAINVEGQWRDVYKDPKAGGKTSKRGRLALIEDDGKLVTIREDALMGRTSLLEPVYANGVLIRDQSFNDVRRLAAI